ncbi:unnamed protein product [Musa acuminata subsp. malaccensis]|uniref:(wild Malaysian banana) hypothetical protein n=1 Tax=Musa acuminata subsp. malaccensis TaxID=214687 RepID=A0A804JMA5_MUSAM|nr:unnamed protein product [Musa acuminata subsp. malaccensis]
MSCDKQFSYSDDLLHDRPSINAGKLERKEADVRNP